MSARVRPALAALAATVVLSGCSGGESPIIPAAPAIDVDTAELREAKAAAGIEDCEPGDAEPVEGGLPEVVLPCFAGGPDVELSALRGPLVLNLWASWCGPCRREMPVLQAFHVEHGERVPVLGVDFQDPATGVAMEQLARRGVTYPSLADTGGELAVSALRITAMPTTVLVAEDGTVARVLPLELESVEELEDLVAEHLGIEL